ncbi:MAG TPA: HAD family hydrolase [Chthoniobacterales bacterium]|jgi:D-glycero-D-manno-heptose 1,7-bisphosphate phosphatase|nr:HAD family hydrolase [Chthoniobacterales bacterium]
MTRSPNESWPAVFLDRDGTLMRDVDYCNHPKKVAVYPQAAPALRLLKEKGYKLVVITNQSGIGRGYFSEEDYRRVEAEFLQQLGEGLIDASYYCPEPPTSTSVRRKPGPGMVFEAQRDHRLDLRRSFFIGDKASDVGCGKNASVRTILVRTGFGEFEKDCNPDWIVEDIAQAANLILKQND